MTKSCTGSNSTQKELQKQPFIPLFRPNTYVLKFQKEKKNVCWFTKGLLISTANFLALI